MSAEERATAPTGEPCNPHDADQCYWDNIRKCYGMTCGAHGCDFNARGATWEEVGAKMDEHVREEEGK